MSHKLIKLLCAWFFWWSYTTEEILENVDFLIWSILLRTLDVPTTLHTVFQNFELYILTFLREDGGTWYYTMLLYD